MRTALIVLFVLFISSLNGQVKLIPTDQIIVEGKVEHSVIFTLTSLDTFKVKSLPDVVISNHLGVVKNTLTKLKGIAVKDILSGVPLKAENPKVLSEFYFVFVATDNYKVVFSWNEIFNTETGNNFYIVTEEGGRKIAEMDKRISMICITDIKTGRRDMRNLQKIIVERVNN